MKLIIICHGFDFEYSNNANAHCLNEMIPFLYKNREITIFTTTTNKAENYNYIEKNKNLEVKYFSISKYKTFKKSFKFWMNFIQKQLMNDCEYTLLTISFPIQTLLIGYELKKINPKINWIVYELDPYAYNEVLRFPKLLFSYRMNIQRNVFKLANKILLTHELYNQYSSLKTMELYKKKFRDIGIPILKFREHTIKNDIKINSFVYVGTFYKNIREPYYMLNLMSLAANKIENFTLDIYGESYKEEYEEYIKISNDKIKFHGRVSKSKINEVILSAKFLVNLGNRVPNQLPSKVFEYIGYEKPIVNIISIDNDPSKGYLSNYSKALTLGGEKANVNIDLANLIQFISVADEFIEMDNRLIFEKETVNYICNLISNEIK